MAKKQTYIDMIREQVKADHNGKVPEHLELTIRNYATTLQSIALYTYGALLSIIRSTALYGTEQYSLIKEKAAATRWELSDRERAIIERLNQNAKQ